MHPLPAHGFPRLVRKKSDWGDWVVSPVWFVMEPTAKRSEGWLCPRGFTDTLAVSPFGLAPIQRSFVPAASKTSTYSLGC